jgi:NADH-quinone oxidoreductase subunit L
MNQHLYLWMIPLLPFAGFLINGLLGRRLPKALVSTIALLFPLAAFAVVGRIAVLVYGSVEARMSTWNGTPPPLFYFTLPRVETLGTWINAGPLHIDFTLALDQLTLVMLLIITGVGFLIHIYSVGYMAHEDGYWRYFAYLNLFLFFMLVLVLSANYLLMFVGWEGVGLASYLLIGFYFDKKSAADAGKKAFVVNRIGDFGFLIAMFLLLANFGTLSIGGLASQLATQPAMQGGVLTAIALCLVLGACGKSAQIPLYIWLPDAMEGPTPVSALIHAATMVTAGVYMIARTHFLFDRSPFALDTVAVIGAATAFFAATVALVQTDIKRVLAYSTISQLGYMFLGCGVAAYSAAIFHLMTHAFFKALLFLAAGSVIHGMNGEQNMLKMGGLRKKMPITFWTMSAGVVAIAGFWPLAGFFSKDAILYYAFQHDTLGKVFYFVGLATALLTSFYIFRLWYLTFFGESRSDDPIHESPWSMLGPLVILAILSVGGGWIGIDRFSAFLAPTLGTELNPVDLPGGHPLDLTLSIVAVAVAAIGWYFARLYYGRMSGRPAKLAAAAPGVYNMLVHKYWIDELYTNTIVKPIGFASRFVLGWLGEGLIIRGSAWLLAGITTLLGELTRRWQSGNLRSYSAWLAAGAAAILLLVVFGAAFGLGGESLRMVWVGH